MSLARFSPSLSLQSLQCCTPVSFTVYPEHLGMEITVKMLDIVPLRKYNMKTESYTEYIFFNRKSQFKIKGKNKLGLSCAKLIFLWVRLPMSSSSCEFVVLWSHLWAYFPVSLSSCKVIFLWGCHRLRSFCEIFFLLGHLPIIGFLWGCLLVRSSSCEVVFLLGRLPFQTNL